MRPEHFVAPIHDQAILASRNHTVMLLKSQKDINKGKQSEPARNDERSSAVTTQDLKQRANK
jgi:hypothetical protein